MGLMICQKLVELNEGKIFVESEGINKGSVFTFSMKMSQADRLDQMITNI